jgi:hypothetical protein
VIGKTFPELSNFASPAAERQDSLVGMRFRRFFKAAGIAVKCAFMHFHQI